MAGTGNITLQANVTGGLDGARSFGPVTITANAAVAETLTVALAIGANTITVPAGATAAVLFPPNAANPTPNPAFSGSLTLKGIAGDTGVAMSNKTPTVLSWDTATLPTSLVINSTVTGSMVVWFM